MRALPLAVLLLVPPLGAQPLVSRTLDSATVVRFHLVRGEIVQGMLLAPLGPDATAIAFAPPPHRDCGVPRAVCRFDLPIGDVRAVEVRQGTQVGRGALIGGGIGALAGVALGMAVADADVCTTGGPGGCNGPSDAAVISVTTLIGSALGAGLGALFGLGSPVWERAP